MKFRLTSFGLSKREGAPSEDAFATKTWDETIVAVLADGVGGARGGAEASARVVEALAGNYAVRPPGWSPQKALSEFAKLINRTLYQESLARFDGPELVSTVTVAVIEGNHLYGLNVGDSRVYLARKGEVIQLSQDHTEAGLPHVLSRAIGLAPDVEPYCFERALDDGDIALLCSDGVSNVLDPEWLQTKLGQHIAARALVQHAREIATPELLDDMSAVVIDIAETGKLRAVSQTPLPIPNDLAKGQIIDGYELIRSFQTSDRVWIASKDGQRWTLKFAPLEAREDESALNHFVREVWNATRIQGDHFVQAFVPEQASARYYVMEFVEAPSLKAFLRSRQLSVDEGVALGRFLLEAGAALLRFDHVHGDIKPENILVIQGYDRLQFKLIDLGSAAEIFSVTSRAGTASYLAPERFREAAISERTEIFAVGATLYQALTGSLPYGEIERFQTPHFHEPKAPLRLNPNIPPWLDSVLRRAVAIQPERRYQHYSSLAFDLANPAKVEPYHGAGAAFIQRDPLTFYRTGFWILFFITLALGARFLSLLCK